MSISTVASNYLLLLLGLPLLHWITLVLFFPWLVCSCLLCSTSILPIKEDSLFHSNSEVIFSRDPFIAGRWEERGEGQEGQVGRSSQLGQSGRTRYTKPQVCFCNIQFSPGSIFPYTFWKSVYLECLTTFGLFTEVPELLIRLFETENLNDFIIYGLSILPSASLLKLSLNLPNQPQLVSIFRGSLELFRNTWGP